MRGLSETNSDPEWQSLAALIPDVLAQFGQSDAKFSLLSYGENCTFRVKTTADPNSPDGSGWNPNLLSKSGSNLNLREFVLRFHAPSRSQAGRILTEWHWLQSLSRSGFRVPQPQSTRVGESIVFVNHVTGPRAVTLLSWMPGRIEPQQRSTELLRRLGRFMAGLHEHAVQFMHSGWNPRLQPNRWDHAGLFGSTAAMVAGWKLLDEPRRQLFDQVTRHFKAVTEQLGQGPDVFGLIHADLHFGNVVLSKDHEIQAIDFDDCGLGYWIYDLAVTLETLEDRPDYAWLRTSLLSGYREVRSLSRDHEHLLEAMIAARRILLTLWLLSRLHHPALKRLFGPYVTQALPKLERFAASISQ